MLLPLLLASVLVLPPAALIATQVLIHRRITRHAALGPDACRGCAYDRSGLPSPAAPCPECGLPGLTAPTQPATEGPPRRVPWWLPALPIVLALLSLTPAIWAHPANQRDLPILIGMAMILALGSAALAWWNARRVGLGFLLSIKLPAWIGHALPIAYTAGALSGADPLHSILILLIAPLALPLGAAASLLALPIAMAVFPQRTATPTRASPSPAPAAEAA
ncbi:MAG: hypothetical protein LAT64_02115 [Phycisphaerales bacterium]|nr:hypothetical protein [Planctomycetota bacterium]MCH8507553.1 hypothetical protein [Phycisphaerales bacterium]